MRARGIEQQRALYADPEWAERKRAAHRDYYFVRGWKVQRLHELGQARQQAVEELAQLDGGSDQ